MSGGDGEEKRGETEERDSVQNNELKEDVKNVERTEEGREKVLYIKGVRGKRERQGGEKRETARWRLREVKK